MAASGLPLSNCCKGEETERTACPGFFVFCSESQSWSARGPAAATAANIRLITILITFRSHSPYYVIYIRLISLRNTHHQPRFFSPRIHFLSLPLLDNFLVAASIFLSNFFILYSFFVCFIISFIYLRAPFAPGGGHKKC